MINNKRVCLFTIGSAGSVFFHSLMSGHPQLVCIPVICDFDRVYRLYASGKDESLLAVLYKHTHVRLLVDKLNSERHGNFTDYGSFDSVEFCNLIDKHEKRGNPKDGRTCSDIVTTAFAASTSVKIKKDTMVFEHPHNFFRGTVGKFTDMYSDPVFLLMVRHPIMQVKSFFSYLYNNNGDIQYEEVTKRLVSLLNSTLEAKKNLNRLNIIKFEDLHRYPEEILSDVADNLGIRKSDTFWQSTLGDSLYFATSPNNNMVHGFNKNITMYNDTGLSKDDIYFIQCLFYEHYKMFGYEIDFEMRTNDDIFHHNFLGANIELEKKVKLEQDRLNLIMPIMSALRAE
jgi:hypothetical protein